MSDKGRFRSKKTPNKTQTRKNAQKNTEPVVTSAISVTEVQAGSTKVKNKAAKTAEKERNQPKLVLNNQVETRPDQEEKQAMEQKRDDNESQDGSTEATGRVEKQISAIKTHDGKTAEKEPEMKLNNQVDAQLNLERESIVTSAISVNEVQAASSEIKDSAGEKLNASETHDSATAKESNQPKVEAMEQKRDDNEIKDSSTEATGRVKEEISLKKTHDGKTAEKDENEPEMKFNNQVDDQLNLERESVVTSTISVNEVQAASSEVKNSTVEKLSARETHDSATAEESNQPRVEANDQVEIQSNQEEIQAIAQKKDVEEMKDGSAEATVSAEEQISANEMKDGSAEARVSAEEQISAKETHDVEAAEQERNQPETELNNQVDTQLNQEEESALTEDISVVQSKHSTENQREKEFRTPENNEGSTNVKNYNSQHKNEANRQVGYQEKPAPAPKQGSKKEENSASGTQNLKTAEKDGNQPETKLDDLVDTQLNQEEESVSTQDADVVKINHSTEDQREKECRTMEDNEGTNDNSQPEIESNGQVDCQENKKEKPVCTQEGNVFKIELSAENKDHVEEEFRTTEINNDSINDGNDDNLLTQQSNKQVASQINKEVKTAHLQEADINKIEAGPTEAKNTAETEISRIGTGEEGNLHDIKINNQDYSLNQKEKPLEETSTEILKILNQMKGTLFLILLQNKFYYEKHYRRNKQKLESDSDSDKPESGDDPRSSEETKKEVLTDVEKESNEKSLTSNDSTHPSFVLNDKIETTAEQSDLKCEIKTEEEATAQFKPTDNGEQISQMTDPHSSEELKKEVLTDIKKGNCEKSLPTNDSTHPSFILNDEIKTTEEQSDLKCEIKTEEEATAQSKPTDDGVEIKKEEAEGVEILQTTTPEQEKGDLEISKTDLQEEMQSNGEIKIPDEPIHTNSLKEFVSDLDPDVTQPIVEDIPDDPLCFHTVHGENIIISKEGFRAQRLKSSNFFSKGVAFSSRPVKLGEQVCLRLERLSSYLLGSITFGFINKDPNTLAGNLPSNNITDQDSKDGYWVVHLDKKYCQERNKLHYFLNSSGNMCFGINGVDQGEFFWKLDTSKPIWAIVYLFGYITALEFDNSKVLSHRNIGKTYSSAEPSDLTDWQSQSSEKNQEQTRTSSHKMFKVLPLSYQTRFVPLDLNTQVKGVRIKFLEGRGMCVTSDIKGGYIFLKEPLIVGQTIVIQNLSTKRQPQLFCIGIKYHPTIEGTKTLNALPDPVAINVSTQYKDELAITFTVNGEIRVTKNYEMPNTILTNAELTQQLWPFVAVYRRNQIIRIWSNNIPTSTMIRE